MGATRSPSWENVAYLVGPGPPVPRKRTQLVVWLRGEHDLSTAASLAETLTEATAAGDGDLAVDLSHVVFMDATIVTTLVRSRNVLRTRSRNLTLRAPSPPARRILDLCGLLGLVDPVLPNDADEPDPRITVPGTWSRMPLGGRAVQAVPPIGRPLHHSPSLASIPDRFRFSGGAP